MTFLLWLSLSVLAYWVAGLLSAFQASFGGVSEKDATPLVALWLLSWLGLTVLLVVARLLW